MKRENKVHLDLRTLHSSRWNDQNIAGTHVTFAIKPQMIPNSDFKRENMSPPQKDRPLDDAERDRLDAILSRFHSQYALNNAEKVDGFFAALICNPEIARPKPVFAGNLGWRND